MNPAEVLTAMKKRVQPLIDDGTIKPTRRLEGAVVIERGVFITRPNGDYEFLGRQFAPNSRPGWMTVVQPLNRAVAIANCARKLTDAEIRVLFTSRVPVVLIREGEELDVIAIEELLGQPEAAS